MTTVDTRRGLEVNEGGEGVVVVTEAHGGWSKGWLARVTLSDDGPYDLEREFLRASEQSLSRAGNGSKTYGPLSDGVYEADSVYRSYSSHRSYVRIEDGKVLEAHSTSHTPNAKDRAKEWLS